MAVRTIVTVPNPVLLSKSEKIRDFDDETRNLAKDLIDTLNKASEPEGAGIAANQIGVSKRMCVVRNFFSDPSNRNNILTEDFVLINPKIISESRDTQIDYEGCLSVPNTWGKVERYKKIKVVAQDLNGDTIKFKASGIFAFVIQHEIDHLDGVLFTSRVIGKTYTDQELSKLLGEDK